MRDKWYAINTLANEPQVEVKGLLALTELGGLQYRVAWSTT